MSSLLWSPGTCLGWHGEGDLKGKEGKDLAGSESHNSRLFSVT